MTTTEIANLIEGLREIGFTDTQITDLQLMMEGRISIEEWGKRFKSQAKKDTTKHGD